MADWDGRAYSELSAPQRAWGRAVLARLTLAGDETVLDGGCGSGGLTADLLDRLPRGRVIATDRSPDMLRQARELLEPRFGDRVTFVEADLPEVRLDRAVDVVFSNAVFHWILDHDRLFRTLFAALRPGGRLHAQCGGGPNLHRLHGRAIALMAEPPYAPHFVGWRVPWNFADAEITAARLRAAGFVDVTTRLTDAPTPFADPDVFRRFIEKIVLWQNLERLPEPLRAPFLDRLCALAATDGPAFTLDYVRLDLTGHRPT